MLSKLHCEIALTHSCCHLQKKMQMPLPDQASPQRVLTSLMFHFPFRCHHLHGESPSTNLDQMLLPVRYASTFANVQEDFLTRMKCHRSSAHCFHLHLGFHFVSSQLLACASSGPIQPERPDGLVGSHSA